MKRYNAIIAFSIIVYIILAISSSFAILQINKNESKGYRVESNRIMHLLETNEEEGAIAMSRYQYIKKIKLLPVKETDKDAVQSFYEESPRYYEQIKPLYRDGELQAYVKFLYDLPNQQTSNVLLLLQVSLFLLEAIILLILWYLRANLIVPFQRLVSLPEELAQGHYKGIVKETKHRYLNYFMRGMGQLKDSLQTSRKRELQLEKEKKKMLLSLSHDVKTPLNLIKLYSTALQEDWYEEEAAKQQAIKQIGNKAEEIENYVETIITSAKEDVLDIPVVIGDFYLQDLMQRIQLMYEEICMLRQVEFRVFPYENKLLKGDIDRSQEVLENIIENALKYGDGRCIEIRFEEEEYCQLVHVYNSGDCVSENEMNHIFESFFRGANSKGKQGSGLGLCICKDIMHKMDGEIFTQCKDEGMVFTLVFR